MKNQPYIKQLDEKGNVLNPIIGKYESKTFLGTQKITDEFNQVRYVPIYLPNRRERRNRSFGKNELVFKLQESYLKQVKKAFANGFENLERTINNIKSTLENYKKAFFNSSLYVKV
jgi:hypothetical protein